VCVLLMYVEYIIFGQIVSSRLGSGATTSSCISICTGAISPSFSSSPSLASVSAATASAP
jgi:hypothetical protein